MKRILVNSGVVACLIALLVSFWIVAHPVRALAASASATCMNGQQLYCESANSQCEALDSEPNGGRPGYCTCWSNTVPSVQTVLKACTDSDEVPEYQ